MIRSCCPRSGSGYRSVGTDVRGGGGSAGGGWYDFAHLVLDDDELPPEPAAVSLPGQLGTGSLLAGDDIGSLVDCPDDDGPVPGAGRPLGLAQLLPGAVRVAGW